MKTILGAGAGQKWTSSATLKKLLHETHFYANPALLTHSYADPEKLTLNML